MIWLLDVSVLVAHLVGSHEHHDRVAAWRSGKTLALCPITELGFLRVVCALGFSMDDARATLAEFIRDEQPLFIPVIAGRSRVQSRSPPVRRLTFTSLSSRPRVAGNWRHSTQASHIR